ncbi:MocR-like pyridoxine biosynthesis transcription factor PdxR [Enterococcus sp. LJL128]
MLVIDRTKKAPLYQQLYEQLRDEILSGIRKEGELLSGSRILAQTLTISRHTVDTAYSQLAAEGYIYPKRGIGFIVAPVPRLTNVAGLVQPAFEKQSLEKNENILYDLTNSSHTSNLFPKKLWQKYTESSLELLYKEEKISSLLDKQGELFLRETLLHYLERMRGVRCSANQMILTSGTQQSLDYLCKLLPNQTQILMEEPGYNKAVSVFKNNSRTVQTVPVDDHGICVDRLPTVPTGSLLYTTPSHQFPTGVTLPVGRRYELLNWASHNHSYIIEDDYDSELRYYAKPIPALQSIARNDQVIYLGTFSKVLSPSLRMSYVILPLSLMNSYQNKFSDYNCSVPLLNQYIVAQLIKDGKYDQHVRRLNQIFKKRLELFTHAFQDVAHKIKISKNGSGQYFLITFSAAVSQEELIKAAAEQQVKVYSTMNFWQEKTDCPPNTLFLGFSKIELTDIPDCAKRLKAAWRQWL